MLFKKFIFALTAVVVTMLVHVQQPVFAAKQTVVKVSKEKKKAVNKAKRKVLYAEGADGDEKLAAARQNYKIAMEMLKKAVEDGHVVKNKKGLYVKKCDKDCNCLPMVPSALKQPMK